MARLRRSMRRARLTQQITRAQRTRIRVAVFNFFVPRKYRIATDAEAFVAGLSLAAKLADFEAATGLRLADHPCEIER